MVTGITVEASSKYREKENLEGVDSMSLARSQIHLADTGLRSAV